jgi:hypothetical protein
LVRRHYTVLARVSPSYSVPLGRFPRVTHPCATSSEELVRLACVRHAASVRSEPGSNSQVCVTTRQARTEVRRPARLSFKEPIPALVKRNGYEGHVSSSPAVGLTRMWHRHRVTGFRSLELPGPGAVAHMSLHQNQQCQRAVQQKRRTTIVPRSDIPGDSLSVSVDDRCETAGRTGITASVKAIYVRPSLPSTAFFKKFHAADEGGQTAVGRNRLTFRSGAEAPERTVCLPCLAISARLARSPGRGGNQENQRNATSGGQ